MTLLTHNRHYINDILFRLALNDLAQLHVKFTYDSILELLTVLNTLSDIALDTKEVRISRYFIHRCDVYIKKTLQICSAAE